MIENKIIFYMDEVHNLTKGGFEFPVTCEIDPSNACMLKCEFCLYKDHLAKSKVHLDWDVYTDLIYQLVAGQTKSITFTGGGEPLLNPKFNSMAEFAWTSGFEIGLITNGVLLHKVRDLSRFTFIRVSLDAANAETYKKVKGTDHFDRVIKNVREALKKNPMIGLSFVVCDKNNQELEEAVELAHKLEVAYIQFKPAWLNSGKFDDFTLPISRRRLHSTDHSIIETDRYIAKGKLPCQIAGLIGIVGADAKLYYCCQHRGVKRYELGSLRNDTFTHLWYKRSEIKPTIKDCPQCRYMNYAKAYEKLANKTNILYSHKNFL